MHKSFDYVKNNQQRFQDELIELLRIPSISTDPQHKNDVKLTADWIAANMQQIGLENIAIMPTGGHPVVYADYLHKPGAPTVLVYGHYDVQPAVIEDGWSQDPFEPVIRDEKLYARGSSDDKGQVMVNLKAAEALIASDECPVNLKFIIEGEEEIGSPNLARFVEENKSLLAADICLISDTGVKGLEEPSIVYSLLGLVSMELVVSGPKQDLHSGIGGIIHNPAQAIAEIVAALHHPDGRVSVPGFYDDVLDLSAEERTLLARAEMPDSTWQAMMGDLPEWGEAGFSRIERTGARPTLEINGISGGYTGDGFKTVLPARASAKISCRLVANQDPHRIFELIENYIASITPATVNVTLHPHGFGLPGYTPIDHPAVQAAARAFQAVWGKEVIYERIGGSIPIVSDFQELLGAPVVLMGFALPNSGAHGPNEFFHLTMYDRGIQSIIHFMDEVSRVEVSAS